MKKEVADIDHTVYLLRSRNPKYLNWSYIGYTVNYQRRLKQHNAGIDKGGAKKTNDKGPWELYLIIIGFMSDVTALRFEWAWQNYIKFNSLREKVGRRKSRESKLNFNLRILNVLLNHPPWHRAPLKIVVFDSTCDIFNFLPNRPRHIEVATQITTYDDKNVDSEICFICNKDFVSDHVLSCYHSCDAFFHVCCCADYLNQDAGHIMPTMGPCPKCHQSLIWGRLIRSAKMNQ